MKHRNNKFPEHIDPQKTTFCYRISEYNLDILERISDEMDMNKNAVLDVALHMLKKKVLSD